MGKIWFGGEGGGTPIFLENRQKFLRTRTSEPVCRLTTTGVITRNVSVELITKCGSSRGGGGGMGGRKLFINWRQIDLTDRPTSK